MSSNQRMIPVPGNADLFKKDRAVIAMPELGPEGRFAKNRQLGVELHSAREIRQLLAALRRIKKGEMVVLCLDPLRSALAVEVPQPGTEEWMKVLNVAWEAALANVDQAPRDRLATVLDVAFGALLTPQQHEQVKAITTARAAAKKKEEEKKEGEG